MQTIARWLLILLGSLLGVGNAAAQKKPTTDDIEHMREELGVNNFTAPNINILFEELESLKPLPFEKIWRDLPNPTPSDRARLALSMGAVIADGFLAVAAEKQSRIEPVGRVLLKLSKGLGVSDRVSKHSRSILEKAARQQWPEIKTELVRTQAEVEAAMLGLKDEEIAHLVALGGWLRGLEITGGIVLEDYTPERSRRLIQPEILEYFLDRAKTLNPNLKKTRLAEKIEATLSEVKHIVTKPIDEPIEKEEAKQIRDLAHDLNKLIASGEE